MATVPTPSVAIYHATPQEGAESLCARIARRERFTASIFGPRGSGKTCALATIAAETIDHGRLSLNEIAAFAPTHLAIRRLRALIGAKWPELDPQADLFPPELSGLPIDALRGHTALVGDDTPIKIDDILRGYLEILAQINDIEAPWSDHNRAFLDSLKPRLRAAINADHEARLDRSLRWPRNAYLDAVREYVAEYKQEHRLLDAADLVHGDYYASAQVRLVLLDELDDTDRALVARHFPNASLITTSLAPLAADVLIAFDTCLRQPERCEIVAPKPIPQLVPPPPDDFGSLLILAPPWRRGPWLGWLSHHGIPPPSWSHWNAMVQAWRYDQGETAIAPALNRMLRKAGLAVLDDFFAASGDVEGWTGWRDVGGKYDARMRDHAQAVLQRYGRLQGLPSVRLGMPRTHQHIEADTVIVDAAAGWPDEESEEIALSRATRHLIVMKKPSRP